MMKLEISQKQVPSIFLRNVTKFDGDIASFIQLILDNEL